MFAVDVERSHDRYRNAGFLLINDGLLFQNAFGPAVTPIDALRFTRDWLTVRHRRRPVVGIDAAGTDDQRMLGAVASNGVKDVGVHEVVEPKHFKVILLAESNPVGPRGQVKHVLAIL